MRRKDDYAAGKDLREGRPWSVAGEHESKDDRLIHVTPVDWCPAEAGCAATDKDIEFASGGMTGHAVGADYSADTVWWCCMRR